MSMTFDLYGVSKIVEQGFARKLELVENALVKLDSSFESLSITETFAFVASPQAGKLYRFNYQISEDVVQFTKPVAFDIDTSRDTLDEQTQKVVRNIVDALAENDETQVDLYRAQWMALERQKYQLEHALNLNVGIKTEKIQKTREFVKEAIESTRGGRSVMRKGVQTTLFTELIENKEIQITPTTPNINVEPISRQRLIYQQIVDGRFAAKELVESPVFAEYAKDLYQGDAEEHQEAVEFIAENHQELYCLSLSEQTEVFYNTLEKAGIKPDASKVVEGILDIGRYAAGVESIREELEKLTAIIEATNGNFHERMQIIEDTINTRTFTNNDVNVLKLTLEKVLAKPSEFLSPEFIIELRKAHNRITTMLENGNYDDRLVAATVHMLSNFYPETMQIGEASYEEFFQSKLNKYGVSSPDEIPDDKKDDFFNEVDAEWKSEDEGGNGEGGKDGVAVDDEEDEMADVNMYGESESCKNCGSPKCLCHGLTEEEEDEEEESGKGKQGDENLEDEEEGTKSKSKTNDPDDAFLPAEEIAAKKGQQIKTSMDGGQTQNAGDGISTEQ